MSKSSARKPAGKAPAEPIAIPRTTKRNSVQQVALGDDEAGNGLWPSDGVVFDRTCTDCPRLVAFLEEGRKQHPDYYCAPVAPFGDRRARLIIVGLAPGFHGANATGRPFTGDYAGELLYKTLYKYGFANKPESVHRNDGLKLLGARITNSVKCVPPDNKPLPIEITTCNRYLQAELAIAPKNAVLLALGSIGHNACLRALGLKVGEYKFGHAAEFKLPGGQTLIDSYHCSRYNTNTRRLTEEMFEAVFARARKLVSQ
ncbi:MAG TPA: uracil-DNA glycosylase [Steroidobacter sp.]